MSTNMDGPAALIEEVMDLPVEDLQTLLVAVTDRLRPVINLLGRDNIVGGGEQLFDVMLTGVNRDKVIPSIKAVRAASAVAGKSALQLSVAKDMVEDMRDRSIGRWVSLRLLIEEAEECVRILEAEGCSGEIRPH